jgi:hypothetical protein
VETKPKIFTSSNGLCELHKCGVRLGNKQKKYEKYRVVRKQKYVSFEKDQLLEGQMNKEKECANTKKLQQIFDTRTLKAHE